MKNLFILITLHFALPLFAAKKEAALYFPPAKGEWEKADPVKHKELKAAKKDKSEGK